MQEPEVSAVEEEDAGGYNYEDMCTNDKCRRAILRNVRSLWQCTLFYNL